MEKMFVPLLVAELLQRLQELHVADVPSDCASFCCHFCSGGSGGSSSSSRSSSSSSGSSGSRSSRSRISNKSYSYNHSISSSISSSGLRRRSAVVVVEVVIVVVVVGVVVVPAVLAAEEEEVVVGVVVVIVVVVVFCHSLGTPVTALRGLRGHYSRKSQLPITKQPTKYNKIKTKTTQTSRLHRSICTLRSLHTKAL